MTKLPRLGKLAPKYTFFLNPYEYDRFTRCPECEELNRTRKQPILITYGPNMLMIFNVKGRYCPSCDLLIMHMDIVESMLATALAQKNHPVTGDSYMILGTVERKTWLKSKKQALGWQDVIDNLHDFKAIVDYESY